MHMNNMVFGKGQNVHNSGNIDLFLEFELYKKVSVQQNAGFYTFIHFE